MRFSLPREVLLKPLQQVVNVVERRQTLPVLSNLLLVLADGRLSITASDLEVEMVGRVLAPDAVDGEITVPARKLYDIVRALPDGVMVTVQLNGDRVSLVAGRSRFTLSTLPAGDFPNLDGVEVIERVRMDEGVLKMLIERTAFAMAQQDVRFYLNGLLFDIDERTLRCVATDGHRLGVAEADVSQGAQVRKQIIVPRKGVMELQRLLESGERELEVELGRSHLRVRREDVIFSTKLIDGRFPDYEAVIPIGADKEIEIDREALRAALQRVAILSNEKYRGVRLEVAPDLLRVVTHNPEQEEASEEIEARTSVDQLAIGFNVSYLLEALAALGEDTIKLQLRDANSSILVREGTHARVRHVVMPLRL
jgi:DNA polymerase-3 subunit beta